MTSRDSIMPILWCCAAEVFQRGHNRPRWCWFVALKDKTTLLYNTQSHPLKFLLHTSAHLEWSLTGMASNSRFIRTPYVTSQFIFYDLYLMLSSGHPVTSWKCTFTYYGCSRVMDNCVSDHSLSPLKLATSPQPPQ